LCEGFIVQIEEEYQGQEANISLAMTHDAKANMKKLIKYGTCIWYIMYNSLFLYLQGKFPGYQNNCVHVLFQGMSEQ
jgi:hypothetical protein